MRASISGAERGWCIFTAALQAMLAARDSRMCRERSAGPPAPSPESAASLRRRASAASAESTPGTEVRARVLPGEGGDAEAVLFETGRELQQAEALGGGEVEEDGRQEVLHWRPLGGQGPAQALVEDALVGHVLVDQVEAVRPFEKDQRPLVLTQETERPHLSPAAGEGDDGPLDGRVRGRRKACGRHGQFHESRR